MCPRLGSGPSGQASGVATGPFTAGGAGPGADPGAGPPAKPGAFPGAVPRPDASAEGSTKLGTWLVDRVEGSIAIACSGNRCVDLPAGGLREGQSVNPREAAAAAELRARVLESYRRLSPRRANRQRHTGWGQQRDEGAGEGKQGHAARGGDEYGQRAGP